MSPNPKGKSAKVQHYVQDQPSSNGINKEGFYTEVEKSRDELSIRGFDLNPRNQNEFNEITLNIEFPRRSMPQAYPEDIIPEVPEAAEEKESSKESQKGQKKLKGGKSKSPKWQWPTMDWTNDLCGQTQCLKKVSSGCDWFRALNKKQQIAVVICAFLLTAAIIVPCIVVPMLLIPPPPEGMYMAPYQFNGTLVNALYIEGKTKNNHTYFAHATHQKIQVPHPTLEAVTKMVRTSSNKEEIHCNVPILAVLAVCGFSHKQEEVYEDWLAYYNANPIEATQKLTETITSTLQRRGTYKFGQWIPDNLTLVSLKEGFEIDIEYLPLEGKFAASNFMEDSLKLDFEQKNNNAVENNLKKEENGKKDSSEDSKKVEGKKDETKKDTSNTDVSAQTPTEAPKNQDVKTADQKQRLMSRAMLEAVYYIKRVVSRNIEVIRAKSAELMDYQQHLVDEKELSQDWQKALVNGCRTLDSLRFRCTIEAAGVLVPGLTLEKIRENGEYLVSQTLNLVFKEVKQTVE